MAGGSGVEGRGRLGPIDHAGLTATARRSGGSQDRRQAGVGPGEEMVMHRTRAVLGKVAGRWINARQRRHVAGGAGLAGVFRIIEAPRAMARCAAQGERVVVVLAAEEIFVVVHLRRNRHLVAGRAELGRTVYRLEERPLVEVGLRLHELRVDPLQHLRVAGRKRIVVWLLERVAAVARQRVHLGDGMADGARDAGVGRGMIDVVVVRIVERPRQQRHRIVAAGAPLHRLRVAIPRHRDRPRLADARQIGRVVERAVVMRRMEPALVGILMAPQAVAVHHQRAGIHGPAVDRAAARRRERILPSGFGHDGGGGTGGADGHGPRHPHRITNDRHQCDARGRRGPGNATAPCQPRPHATVRDVEADRSQWHELVQDEHDHAGRRSGPQLRQALELHEREARQHHDKPHGEEPKPATGCHAVGPVVGDPPVRDPEDHERNRDGRPEGDVHEKHPERRGRGCRHAAQPFDAANQGEVAATANQHRRGGENDPEQRTQATAHGRRPAAVRRGSQFRLARSVFWQPVSVHRCPSSTDPRYSDRLPPPFP